MDRYDCRVLVAASGRAACAPSMREGSTTPVARAFPDDESVNAALRAVLDAAKAVRSA